MDRHRRGIAVRPWRLQPEGIRIGGKGGQRSAVKVWEEREYKDYDGERELGTRNIKVALRRLRRSPAKGGGGTGAGRHHPRHRQQRRLPRHPMQPERKNKIKVLMLFDVGGTMDDHIERTEELFSAARTEFKNMEFFYFHNCVYDYLWKNNRRRHAERFPTWDVLRKYTPDTKLIRGRRHHEPLRNPAAGRLGGIQQCGSGRRVAAALHQYLPALRLAQSRAGRLWQYRQSIALIRQLMNNRMFPLTMDGLEGAMRLLSK
jgi:uncharacterized protein with von Willebrand factor type A (vWA) domain